MKNDDLLARLIRACVDDELTLQHERKFVDEARGEVLARLAREREGFVVDLERLAGETKRRPTGSWAELLREAGRNAWVGAAGRNNGDAIASCRHSRARTEATYEQALRAPLPDAMQRVVAQQRQLLHDETLELNRMQF